MLQIKKDYRLGGVPRYYLAREGEVDRNMQVSDEIRKCVVFVCYKNENCMILPRATAFIVHVQNRDTEPAFHYLVAAKHSIEKAADKSKDGKIWIRVNLADGSSKPISTDKSDWKYHPYDDSVDVAVLCFSPQQEFDHQSIPIGGFEEMVATDQIIRETEIGVGDEVFLTGLFVNHDGSEKNLPIVRAGNIALMPGEQVETKYGYMDAYLIEARSIGGHSGSPVFVYFGSTRRIDGNTHHGGYKLYYWLGLMHGHWNIRESDIDVFENKDDSREKMNMGIAIVVPASKVLEVINQESFIKERQQVIDKMKAEKMPVPDSGFVKKDEETFEDVLKKVSRPKPSPPDQEES